MVIANDTPHAMTDLHGLPPDVEDMAPGPQLAALLAAADRSSLSDHDTVRLLVARDRLVSHWQAQRAGDIAEVTRRSADSSGGDTRGEFAACEVAAALRLTHMAAQHEVALALAVTERLPAVGELLGSGRIDGRRARVLVDGTDHLAVETARRVIADVAESAPQLTTGQLRARLRKLCISVDPADAAQRVGHAVEQRRVVLEATADGAAHLLLLDLPPDLAAAARHHVDQLARRLPHDGRTMDQRRADTALDLLCGRGHHQTTGGGGGMVDITVELGTLLGLADTPGELAGFGPVVADITHQVVDRQHRGRWQATVIDDNGDPYAVAVRRRPTRSQARQIRARYRTCVFPGCRQPACRCDLDHTASWCRGGATLQRNLGPLCRYHHRAKHQGRWRYRRQPNGDHLWTSPLGHTYHTSGRSP